MNLVLASKINKRIKAASRTLGVEEREVVDRALLSYLDNVEGALAMKNEFAMWEKLSDEAWSQIKD